MDTGGPRREFFRLLAANCRTSVYFRHGDDTSGSFFACNTSGYQVFERLYIILLLLIVF